MPRDDSTNEISDESYPEGTQDQLWSMIEACKQNGHAHRHGHAGASANGGAKALINALYRTFTEDHKPLATDGLAARARLLAEISSPQAVPAAPHTSARRFWGVPGKRQLLLAAALIIITVAAIGYLIYASQPAECPPGSTIIPGLKQSPRAPAPVPGTHIAAPAVGINRLLPGRGASLTAPAANKCL
jgi:hypothetical protein